MSKDQQSTYLLFKQAILIEGYKIEDQDKGMLTTKGYADERSKYQTYENILYFQNYRDAIFQIIPAGNFEIHDEILKDYPSKENLNEKDSDNLKKLLKRAQDEAAQFQLFSTKNSEVFFGTDVMFKHLDSQSYLCGTIDPSEGDNGAFAVKVSSQLSSDLIWKLLPYRSFEFSGMPIPFGSPIQIQNVANSSFLTFEKIGRSEPSQQRKLNQKSTPSDESFHIPIKKKSEHSKIYSVVSHSNDLSQNQETPMPWKFQLHMNNVENEKLIQHDIVYFEHSQSKGVLTAFKNQVALKENKVESWVLSCYDCLWEIERYSDENEYILRHLMSGMTLSFVEKQNQNGKRIIPMLTEIASAEQLGTIQMRVATKQIGQINSSSKVHFYKDNLVLDIVKQASEPQLSEGDIYQAQTKIIQSNYNAVVEDSLEYVRKDLELTEEVPTHCFIIMEIDDDTKKQVLFALSFHQTLISLIDELKWGTVWAEKKITYKRMIMLNESLQQIKGFIKNCDVSKAEQEQILPIQKRQTICKDLGMSELLFELLFYMKINKKENIFHENHNENQKFDDLYNTCYEVIEIMVKNHTLFKVHVSRWIDFVVDDVIENQSTARLNSLLEILEGNNLIIQNFITDGFIKHLTDQFNNKNQTNKIKYLKFFRAFCIVNDKPITKNQSMILEHFIKKCEGTQNSFNFRIEKDVLQIQASLDKSKSHQLWRQFTDYHKAVVNEDRDMWNYFIQYMHLLADLCYGRNKFVKSYLQKTYDLLLLISLLKSPSVNEAYVPVLRLVLHLYIEGSAYYPITRMNRILKYENVVPEPLINSCTKEGKYWNQAISHLLEDLMNELMSFDGLNSIVEENEQKEKESIEKNQKLKIILKAILKTIELGYWTEFSDLVKIIKKIQKIIENNPKVIMNQITQKQRLKERYQKIKQQFKLSSRKNKVLIDCQQIATQIILKIKDFQSDLRMRQTCFIFKALIFSGGRTNDMHKGDPKQSLQAGAVKINQQKVQMWVDRLKEVKINKQELLDKNNITRILIELSQYNNPKLISQSLEIMKMVYDSREENINNFCQLTLVDSGEYEQWYEYISKRAEKFFVFEDQNTLKVTIDTQFQGYYNISKQANDIKDCGIMQDLYMFWELMKNENKISAMKNRSLGQSNMFQFLASDRLLNLSNERETNNKLKQKIMKSTQIHALVLYYITNCQSIPNEQLACKLLHMCYIFLTGLIVNNQQSKLQIEKHVEPMKNHLKFNVGAIDFFKQMYDNNKNMLYNQNQIRQLTISICEIINALPIQDYYRSKLLDFFRSLIFFNDKNLKFNQIHILKIMQDDEYNNILIPVNREGKDRVAELIAEFDKSNVIIQDQPLSSVIKMSAELTYVYSFFQIMAVMIEGKNIVNIGKLTKRHPFQMLVEYIEVSGKCWPLRRNIRAYLNKLYYINDGLECYLKTVIEKELGNIIFDLNCYIQSKISSRSADFQLQIMQNPVRFTYMQSYLYLNLEQVLYSLYEILHHKQINKEINQYIATKTTKIRETDQYSPSLSLAYSFLMITQRLGYIRNYFNDHKCIYTCHLIKYIQGKLRAMITDWPDFVFEIHPSQRSMKNNEKVKMRESLINKLIAGDIGSVYARMSKEEEKSKPLCYELFDDKNQTYRREPAERDINKIEEEIRGRLVEILLRTRKNESDRNKQLQEMMGTLLNTVKLSQEFEKYTKQNFLEMANFFSNTDSESGKIYYGQPYITKQQYIKIIITMNTIDPDALSPSLKIFFLKLMTRSISEKNKKDLVGKPIDEWDTIYWDGFEPFIVQQQKRMVNCGLATFITELLSSKDITQNIDLANEILICGIAFLLGGYDESQAAILDILSKDEDNKVFQNIQRLIKKLGDLIYKNNKKKRIISKDSDRTFQTNRCDNYDHYDAIKKCVIRKNVYQPDNAKEEQYKNTCIAAFRRSFKFIQLLCENNNNTGKNFIREQKTKEGTKKLNSINFIQLATNELRQMFKVFCNETMEIPIFIMDFINEVTQIPVMENQGVLMRSTFFEDLCQMEDSLSKEQNLRERDIGEKGKEALSEIYSKAVTIILSNFQGNKQDTFALLDDKLESKFLINILDELLKSQGLTNVSKFKSELKKSKLYIFSEGIQNIINILFIFKKMEEKVPDGKLVASYKEYKDNLKDQNRDKTMKMLTTDHLDLQTKSRMSRTQSVQSIHSVHSLEGSMTKLTIPSQENVLKTQPNEQIIEQQDQDLFGVIENLQKRILKIEITPQDGENQIVYFPKHPVFSSLSQQLRNKIMTDVKRQSHRQKIVSLFKLYPQIKSSMQHSFELQKKQSITESYINMVKTVSCIISILITVMLMINYNIVIEYQAADFYLDGLLIKLIVKLLCFAHLGISYYYFVLWRKARGGTKQKKEGGQQGEEKQGEEGEENSSDEDSKTLQPFYKDQAFIQQAIFFFFSVLGTFYQPYLFTLQLLDIFIMIDVLKDIFQAIATNIKPLAIVSGMGVAFMFIFCLIGFSNYMKNIYQNESIDQMCQTVSGCILDMYVSGVIGETSGKFDWTRFSYDSIYFVFFGLLFGNIISGIMINSFAEKRQKKDQLQQDKRNNCYICNINRDAIEKLGDTFQKHTRSNHFLWNYIFYKYALERKDPTQYTGLEYYISDKISKQEVEINWIPDNQKGEFSAEDSVEALIEVMKEYDNEMNQNIDELDEKVEEINKCNDDIIRGKMDRLQVKIEDIKRAGGEFVSNDRIEEFEGRLDNIKKNRELKKGEDQLMNKLESLDRSVEEVKRSKEENLRNRIKALESRWENGNGRRGGNVLGNGDEAEEI